ncbi:helix-turn-helix transcriptional regulator [Clostridium sp. MD294]|uniref:helix-turn-helix domain-containing protein n=1 Tax=Clostridium sp. MD294 TaxID=97138 RepID=UPI0002CC3166|nr:helix-turn-helix transcriptional regulator [Clostridium sp. MD294]NDO45998.1 helix-turn-helix transcriptional regulator [Clostridium sp. MD294]USF30340.1 hypothetical protein C820_001781 [Clostridium sp. MD294]
MSVGTNVKKMRLERNITQKELGEKVAVSFSFISQIERGTKSLSMELAKEIADVFGCKTDDFLKDI